jgi:anaerobic dimethyl sulfoxide reductase subunit B (iron-sulfur subunit)
MQLGYYFDQNRCMGCSACRVACKDWHDIPAGPENWMRLAHHETGVCPEVMVSYLASPCFHCFAPLCAAACPVGALSKRAEDGLVLVDEAVCLGNEVCDEKCRKACPYSAPQFGSDRGAKMRKCNFCVDRLAAGKKPSCVEACPTRALDIGPLEELEARPGTGREAEDFKYSTRVGPAVAFVPKRS